MKEFRKTKIVCTLGPASASYPVLLRLIRAGMDAVRLNLSHGTHQDHLRLIRTARSASKETGKALAIILDLQGARIRVGKLKSNAIELDRGKILTLSTENLVGDEKRISVTYRGLTRDLKVGHRILIDDGRIDLKVLKVKRKEIDCRIMRGGILRQHKGINLPGVPIRVPVLTKKDLRDLRFALEQEIDYIALSFVRSGRDVLHLKKILQRQRKDIPVIAKIERGEAVDDLERIILSADAIMVARGDLGVELATEQVPMLQKRIVQYCNTHAKPVIIATQMLESMMENPRPTRAEASDVANAVLDGADAVMLSGETSVGKFPVEAVIVMDKIIRKAEENGVAHSEVPKPSELKHRQILAAIGQGTALLAEKIKASAILTLTHTGATARAIARYRPKAKILAMTDQKRVICRVALIWGVRGIYVRRLADTDTTFEEVRRVALRSGEVRRGDFVIATAGIPLLRRGTTNMLKIEKI